jgi:hypothetical protein
MLVRKYPLNRISYVIFLRYGSGISLNPNPAAVGRRTTTHALLGAKMHIPRPPGAYAVAMVGT